MRAISTRSQDRIADVGTVTSEVLGAMKIVQAFNQQDRETSRFADAVERVFATAKRRILLRAIMTAIVIFLMFGAITMVIWQGAIDVAAGRMTGGTIAAFVLYGGLLAGAFGALSEVYGDLLRAAGASERLAELLDAEPDIRAPANPAKLPDAAARRARRSSMSPSTIRRGRETSALNDFSLAVKPRERLAVVGPSGAGKTTIFQLAERFYDPQDGRVLLDGVDLKDADPADIRQRIAMVPQETVIFAACARDNLRYGNWDASEDADLAGRARRQCRGIPARASRRARHVHGRRRRAPVRRPASAHRDCARAAARCAAAAARRSDLRARRRKRAAGAGRARPADGASHDDRHRAPARDRARGRPHRRHGRGRIVEEGTHATLNARGGLYARLARLQFEDRAA